MDDAKQRNLRKKERERKEKKTLDKVFKRSWKISLLLRLEKKVQK